MTDAELLAAGKRVAEWLARHVVVVRVLLFVCVFGALALLISGLLVGPSLRTIGDVIRVVGWVLATWLIGWVIPNRWGRPTSPA